MLRAEVRASPETRLGPRPSPQSYRPSGPRGPTSTTAVWRGDMTMPPGVLRVRRYIAWLGLALVLGATDPRVCLGEAVNDTWVLDSRYSISALGLDANYRPLPGSAVIDKAGLRAVRSTVTATRAHSARPAMREPSRS